MLDLKLVDKLQEKLVKKKIIWDGADACDVRCFSLAQLIDICVKNTLRRGNKFILEQLSDKWWEASSSWETSQFGKTPEEAVVNLILKNL